MAIVTKRARSESNTNYAQGGIASVTSPEDSFELHVRDTLEAGAGLCDEAVVRTIVTDGPARVRELIEFGVHFDERENGGGRTELDLGREGGHSKRRILHSRDVTGREIERSLLAAGGRAIREITLLENHTAVDLITLAKLGYATEDRVLGVYVLDETGGAVLTMRSNRVILATGGCGKVYLYTTNPSVATGDAAQAMASGVAGAAIANMEFIQFHPTCLFHPEARSFLISEAVRGEGARLLDEKGRSFMEKYDPRKGTFAPRDIVARAIDTEMKRTGAEALRVPSDITHKPAGIHPGTLPQHLPHLPASYGIDITKDRIPVVPAAHYQCGGVVTDMNGWLPRCGAFMRSARSAAPASTGPTAWPAIPCSKRSSSLIAAAEKAALVARSPLPAAGWLRLDDARAGLDWRQAARRRMWMNLWSSITTGTRSAGSCGIT